jgi:AraC family cel operon transcriptional repressor
MSQPLRKIKFNEYKAKGESLAHIICHHLQPGRRQPSHTHDFAEVFWCVSGKCLHTINGQQCIFRSGMLILMRPNDVHELYCEEGECVYYLLSVPAKTSKRLATSYPEPYQRLWQDTASMPTTIQLSTTLQHTLTQAFQELQNNPQNAFLVDRFLLNMLHDLDYSQTNPYKSCPAWLQNALQLIKEPKWFSMGIKALEEITGRSREHIARTLKRHSSLSPSQALNRARTDYAASQLVITPDSIASIAYQCGYASLGQFYNEFKKAHGYPPRAYRQKHRQVN